MKIEQESPSECRSSKKGVLALSGHGVPVLGSSTFYILLNS